MAMRPHGGIRHAMNAYGPLIAIAAFLALVVVTAAIVPLLP